MAKIQQQFVCQECGGWHSKWSGRCDTCGAWNSIVEEAIAPKQTTRHKRIDTEDFFFNP